ncbi:nodulin MtN21 /EamA-like transporter family protein [Perilla frutescens var. hirtella]|uniref:WAT1-related protein n=1 Tax=Perilla frutescens var. hirtella TaxID=608512 RepID=A0AAD4IW73_PERFH|nr:nodulin MtN21 /EamA-like transporter family protein [Perilla frutescens var. hirtella]
MSQVNIPSERVKLLISLIILQLCFAGFHIVSRVALNLGVSKIVYPIYRNIIALLLIGPFAYFMEKKDRTPLTFSLLAEFFLLALVGITANQVYYILGLYYASPTFVSAMQNSVPALTFIMASALRIEEVNVVRMDGLAKILGTLASIGGATVITLYKGNPILHGPNSSGESMQSWTWGCVFTFCHCLSWAAWMVLQAPIVNKYPAKLSLTSFTLFFGLIQFLVIAAFTERDPTHWQIVSGEEIFTILYAGIISSGLVIALQTWCIKKGGPVFVASFQPVQTVLVAGMASILLGDQLYSGGVIGAVFIMIGLYLVLWGKTAEARYDSQDKEETLAKHLLESNNNNQECPTRADIP